jgi:hypothetical protein
VTRCERVMCESFLTPKKSQIGDQMLAFSGTQIHSVGAKPVIAPLKTDLLTVF